MRKAIYRGVQADAAAVFQRAPFVHLAGVGPDTTPVVRALHGVVVDGQLCFHGAPAGEKLELVERPVVVTAQEVIAEIPSYFIDETLACPATTYYRSAQVTGELRPVEDASGKAAVLQALMRRYQPEGGHAPIDAADPRYASRLRGVVVLAVDLAGAVGKVKLGQNRRPGQIRRVLQGLWRRGGAGDPEAIEIILSAHPCDATPDFLRGVADTRLTCALTNRDLEGAVSLLRGTYWNASVSDEQIACAQLGSAAWVGARDPDGRLVATARAVSDGRSYAYVGDVAVHPRWRRRGVGRAVVALLLDHPAVRHVRRVHLVTKDAQRLYEPFGFEAVPPRPPPFSHMLRLRPDS